MSRYGQFVAVGHQHTTYRMDAESTVVIQQGLHGQVTLLIRFTFIYIQFSTVFANRSQFYVIRNFLYAEPLVIMTPDGICLEVGIEPDSTRNA